MRSVAIFLSMFLAAADASISQHNPFYCYSQDPIRPQIGMFSTISTYETNRGRHIDPTVSSCAPSKFWFLSRHGTRLPSVPDLNRILQLNEKLHIGILRNYDAGKSTLCAADMALIRNWRWDPNITIEFEQHLTNAGWNEFQGLAERFQAAFPEILPSTYSSQDYLFRTTGLPRTVSSLFAFADGLFGFNGHQQVEFAEITLPDVLLRPHMYCELYLNATRVLEEQTAFIEGPEYQNMISEVSAKLGFLGSETLRSDEVETLALICQFEQIWDIESISPLCSAFSVSNFQVLEYKEDLDFYYRTGYGNPDFRRLFENINCHLMEDLLSMLQSDDPNDLKAKIYSTHTVVLPLLLVTFGVFEDEIPLTRHNIAQQTFRLWKTSLLLPKGSNLSVVRYDCADGDNDILFLLNEKPLQIAGCQSNGLCKQSVILQRFSRFLNGNCMETFCSNS